MSAVTADPQTPPARAALRARLSFLLRVAIAGLLLAFIVRQLGGFRELLDSMRGLSVLALLAALAANTADRVLMTWKWILLLRARGHDLSVIDGTRIYCASMVWGMFLPATMGSDAIRALSTVRRGLPAREVIASIVVERALGLLASLVVGLLGLLAVSLFGELPAQLSAVWWLGGLLLGGAVLALGLSFSERTYRWIHEGLLRRVRERSLVRRLRELHETHRSFRADSGTLWSFWWLSVLEQLGPFFPIWILTLDLGIDVPPVYLAGAVALSFLVARVPVSLGGIGVMEGTLVVLLSLVGIPGPQAVVIALAGRIVEVVSWLPWWVSFVLHSGSVRRPRGELSR